MKRRLGCLLALLLLAGFPAPSAAGQDSGRVVGRVVDQTGGVLPGVTVELVANREELTATTDVAGSYRFDRVHAGPGELTFRLLNFTVARRPVTIASGTTATVDVAMTLALNADVIVTAPSTFRNVADVPDPAANLVGIAASASQGAITAAQLEVRPTLRAGEVLETVPGLIVSQHSGEGKANQYYLRGFNLDHGTDFALTIAGIPINTPTGGHAHGYADSNFLIPELVSGVQFKKGPYFADEGDFSAAGAANVQYVNELFKPLVEVSGGGYGWGRMLAGASARHDGGVWLGALELNRNDGPWVRHDDYRKMNGILRYSRGDNQRGLTVTGQGSWAGWNSTDQIPVRAVDSGAISRYGAIDPTDRGTTNRQSVALELQRSQGPSSFRANAFVLRNSLNLFSNFTYFLDDPVNGDQFEQAERRVTVGGRATYRRLGHLGNKHTESAVGVQTRVDWLQPVGLSKAIGGTRVSAIREDRVNQAMTGMYAQTEIEWARVARTAFGVRTDVYHFDVASDNPLNSGAGSSALVSPKFGTAFGPWRGTEFYVNAGYGFHSNDARGAVTTVDPRTLDPVERVTPLVRGRGAEVGLRTVAIRGVQSTVALWYLDLDSELLFVGDAGTTEAGLPSRRHGIEWTNYARLRPWLTVDADVSFSRARFVGPGDSGDRIPGALDRVVTGGVTVEPRHAVFGSIRVRHFGPRPLTEDGSVMSDNTTLWNAEVGYRLSKTARLVLEGFNLFDAKASDIDYFYTSRLPGEPAEGIDDVHTHPVVPRSIRVAVRFAF
jgi:hypothetical protein